MTAHQKPSSRTNFQGFHAMMTPKYKFLSEKLTSFTVTYRMGSSAAAAAVLEVNMKRQCCLKAQQGCDAWLLH